ncbi:MAG: ComEC/Rec2 family competence protein, partial [Melioribacteraceae bacterium]
LNIRSKIIYWFLMFCVTSIAAQLGTLPFTLTYFHRLSISSLAANLVVIPLSGAIVALGIFTVIAGSVSLWLASIFASANELMTYFLYWFVKILGKGEYSYLSINQFSVYDAVIFYLALFFIFIVFKKLIKPVARIIAVSLSILLMVSLMRLDNYELMPEKILSVMAVDVGQGDAFLIRFPNGKTSLIDAGNKTPYFDNGERIIIPLLNRLGIDTLDYGFISHVDADHYKGFEALVKERRIKRIYKPLPDSSSPPDMEFEGLLRSCRYVPVYYSKESIQIENARIYVLNDTINNYFGNRKSNDRSGMLKLVHGGTSILFTGDAGTDVENDYRKKYGSFLKSDILKIGHHGSRSSTGELFLDAVDPEFAIISAGIKNKFRHPSKSIVERLMSKKIKILRTDESGAILIRSDGREIKNINWKNTGAAFNF